MTTKRPNGRFVSFLDGCVKPLIQNPEVFLVEFTINFKLISGSTVTATVEVEGDDLLVGLVFPMSEGEHLDRMLSDAHLQREQIEAAALEAYYERRKEIAEAGGAA